MMWNDKTRVTLGALAGTLTLVGSAFASNDISNLGPPTADVPGQYDSLGGFHPVAPLRAGRKIKLELFDTQWDIFSAADRWPLIKALDQFGTWSGLAPGKSIQPLYAAAPGPNGTTIPPGPMIPTFDLAHAHYRSQYVGLNHTVLQERQNGPRVRLPAATLRLITKVLHLPLIYGDKDATVMPVVLVGRYGAHGSGVSPADLAYKMSSDGTQVLQTFSDIESTVQRSPEGGTNAGWVSDLNRYANVVTAFICAQDGRRPAGVCNRHPIKYILSRIPHLR